VVSCHFLCSARRHGDGDSASGDGHTEADVLPRTLCTLEEGGDVGGDGV